MADHPQPKLSGLTPLQFARTPYMDLLAKRGVTGQLRTVADGFHPGSEVANLSVLGYDLPTVYEGRGVLEAASIGVDLQPGDMAMRCNLVCIEGDILKNHSAGHITTDEADLLIQAINENLGSDKIRFYTGVSYRHLLVVRGGDKRIECVPPHDVPLHPFRPLMIKACVPEAEETARLLNQLILKSQELLDSHPVNLRRAEMGKDKANSIWPWSPGYRPRMQTLQEIFGIKRGAVISAVDLIREAALDALRTDDFVYLHIEASDEAGHEGDVQLKIRTIENLDRRVIRTVVEELKSWSDEVAIAVLPDHPTPCEIRTHTAEPVPFLMYKPGSEADSVETFDEFSVLKGKYGLLEGDQFIREFLK